MAEHNKAKEEKGTSGWLYKWTNYIHGYQTRWFVISNGFMSYYRSSGDVVDGLCRGAISLSSAAVYPNDAKSFIVSSGQDTFHLKANTTDERDMWVRAIGAEADKIMSVSPDGNKLLEDLLSNLEKKFDQMQSYTAVMNKKTPALQKEYQALMKMELAPKVQQKLQVLLDLLKILVETFKSINVTSAEVLVISGNVRNELRSVNSTTKQLEEMVEELGLQHRNLEKKIQQTLNLIQHTKPMTNLQEADNEDNQGSVGEDDEFFDAQTEATNVLLIKMPSSKKFETEERNLTPKDAHVTWSAAESKDETADDDDVASDDCIACVFQRKPKQVCFNEPLTFLQRLTEELEYSDSLDKAARCESSLEQMTHVAAFAISSYASTALRVSKPFNPLLGETYECDRRADYGWKSFAEQVSHHPPTVAMHAEGKEWTVWQEFTMVSKFKGHYLQVNPVGYCHLLFPKTGNHYTWQKVETTVHNIIVGQVWLDHHGETTVINHQTGDRCQLVFHAYSYIYRDNNKKVTGIVSDANGEVKYFLQGNWDDKIETCLVLTKSASSRGKLSFTTDEPVLIWKNIAALLDASYKFTQLAIQLNEPEPNVAPTDSRLRPDLRLMEEGAMDEADKVKVLLEEKQRSFRRRRQSMAVAQGLEPEQAEVALYEPKWFKKEQDPQTGFAMYRFTHEYWNCKKRHDWSRCQSIFL